MKPNHKFTLYLVAVTTLNAVLLSACGEFTAAVYALAASALLIFNAKTEDQLAEALRRAKESNDGWGKSIEMNKDLLDKIDRIAAGQFTQL
jgi:hypothetical protein